MGCFDTIYFKQEKFPKGIKLPKELKNLKFNKLMFQTKDLGEGMGTYEVREDKYLYEYDPITKWIQGNPSAKSFSERFGYQEVTKEKWKKRDSFTGYITVYTDIQDNEYGEGFAWDNDYWIDVHVHFQEGKMVSIKVIKLKATPSIVRKKRELEFIEQRKRAEEISKKFLYRYFYKPYWRSIRWIFTKYRVLKHLISPYIPSAFTVESFLIDPMDEIDRQKRIIKFRKGL